MHPLNATKINDYLIEQNLESERKSIYRDINVLKKAGFNIESTREGAYMNDLLFQLPELKLLVDAVLSSSFITPNKTGQLIQKLTSLTNEYDAIQLTRHLFLSKKKTENEKYLVEIVYNYAKIEVIVEEEDLNSTVTEAIIVLASIEYNDSFLSGLSEESLLSYKEEFVDIFNKDTTKDTTNFLKYEDELDIYNGTDSIPDYDMIKGSD